MYINDNEKEKGFLYAIGKTREQVEGPIDNTPFAIPLRYKKIKNEREQLEDLLAQRRYEEYLDTLPMETVEDDADFEIESEDLTTKYNKFETRSDINNAKKKIAQETKEFLRATKAALRRISKNPSVQPPESKNEDESQELADGHEDSL